MTRWSVARMANDDLTVTDEVLLTTEDQLRAQGFFAVLQRSALAYGGSYELRRDGKYVCLFSCVLPVTEGETK